MVQYKAQSNQNYMLVVFFQSDKKKTQFSFARLYSICMVRIRYDNVTLIPFVLQLGLRIGPIQRMGAN